MSAAPPAAPTAPIAPAAPIVPTASTAPAVTPPVTPAIKKPAEITDPQTGRIFLKLPERWYDVTSAWLSAAYSLAVIGYLTFMVLYMLSGKYAFWPEALTNKFANLLAYPVSKLILYTAIGGAMGAAVNNLRSFISWHAEEKAFGWRFIWKYLAMPPLGGTLAVLVYGILQGGIAVINGGAAPESNQLTSLSAWATGTLAGYGSHKVFIWLDDKVNTLFKIEKKQVTVPDVTGKTRDEAKQILSSAQLSIGAVSEQAVSAAEAGRIITQTPSAGTQIDCGTKVDLIVGVAAPTDTVDPIIANELLPKSQNGNGNGNGVPKNGAGVLANESAITDALTGTETSPENNGAGTDIGTGTGTGAGTTDATLDATNNNSTGTLTSETETSETTESTETTATETEASETKATEG
jgi:PASTA domain